MAEISAEVGVPASTLYQWAARGKWRLGDLAADQGLALPASAATSGTEVEDWMPALPVTETAGLLMEQASRHGLAGQLPRAAAAARLAKQLLELAVQEAEARIAQAAADRKTRRQLPPELVGIPLNRDCSPQHFPPGWDLERALAGKRQELIPLEVLREHLAERLIFSRVPPEEATAERAKFIALREARLAEEARELQEALAANSVPRKENRPWPPSR
tara:strand:- start:67542 stop:68195 length:654 start_codon:yes stop_codon:yes gene_type:complete